MTATATTATITSTSAVAAEFLMVGEVLERAGVLVTVDSRPERDELAREVSFLAVDEWGTLTEVTLPMGAMVPLWS